MVSHRRNDEPTIDREVRPGDIALDQSQGTWVGVAAQAAPDVATWNQENDDNLLDYPGNWLCGATLGDRVFVVTYLGGNGVKSTPSGSYDVPESRLARYPVEEANQDLRRPQVDLLQRFITRLLSRAKRSDFDTETGERSGDLAETIATLAEETLPFSPLGFDCDVIEAVLDDADAEAEADFQDHRERWEDAQDSDPDAADSAAGDDADSDAQDSVDDQADDPETIEADLGTEDVGDVDDSGLETTTTDAEADPDSDPDPDPDPDDADDGDGDGGGELGGFEDFDA